MKRHAVVLSVACGFVLGAATQAQFHNSTVTAAAAVFFGGVTLATLALTPPGVRP